MTQSLSPPPSLSQPIALGGGVIAREWYRWLYAVAQQAWVGGGNGTSGPDAVVPVGPSPFVYTATQSGTVFLSGGGITALAISRSGPPRAIGAFRAPVPMSAGDSLSVTWTQTAPTMAFFPR